MLVSQLTKSISLNGNDGGTTTLTSILIFLIFALVNSKLMMELITLLEQEKELRTGLDVFK